MTLLRLTSGDGALLADAAHIATRGMYPPFAKEESFSLVELEVCRPVALSSVPPANHPVRPPTLSHHVGLWQFCSRSRLG